MNMPNQHGFVGRPASTVPVRETHVNLVSGGVIDLYNLDCVAGMERLEDRSVGVTVTSPPYNVGTNYGVYDDSISRADYLSWLSNVCSIVHRKLRDDGSFFLNIGSTPRNPWGHFEVISALRGTFVLQNVIHWVKSIYVENDSYGRKEAVNVGHYKPINSSRFINDTHEYIFHLTKQGDVDLDRLAVGVPYKDSGNVTRWKDGGVGVRCRGNTWYVPYQTITSRTDERPHPASFPAEIADMCIRLHGVGKGPFRVLDPFMGIGNTALASKALGLSCTGFEIDPDYYQTSVRLLGPERSPATTGRPGLVPAATS
jgi:site-specific DNA-methyltransferase (adenine-specific)